MSISLFRCALLFYLLAQFHLPHSTSLCWFASLQESLLASCTTYFSTFVLGQDLSYKTVFRSNALFFGCKIFNRFYAPC
ncbi:hypothetical protein Y032_0022g479 [Ancylostoma ceylanicum]|uniref:Secreted protein n=1 Tax=Ancylostoma ceylanicum TaxID=53326 RepID=A0A016UYR9_9BILA|nr:hypothetical protein Y032_0022g479 [Ancylostoma ceylanicum]